MRKKFAFILASFLVALASIVLISGTISASGTKNQGEIERIGPEAAREMVAAGDALLVCSYSDKRCKSILLEGAMLRGDLDAKIASIPMDQNMIFYCG